MNNAKLSYNVTTICYHFWILRST